MQFGRCRIAAGLLNLQSQILKPRIHGLCAVQCRHRIVLQYPVLDDHNRCRNLAVAQKQGIMSDAQTNHDVEIAAVRGKRLGLHDRVAHGFVSAAAVELFLVRHADLGLVLCTDLAAERELFVAFCLQTTVESGRLSHPTDTGRDADLFITHPLD